jgi:hypothetical protein
MISKNISKENKKGIKLALDKIKKLQKYDLEYEWISKNNKGKYILIDEAKSALINILKGK